MEVAGAPDRSLVDTEPLADPLGHREPLGKVPLDLLPLKDMVLLNFLLKKIVKNCGVESEQNGKRRKKKGGKKKRGEEVGDKKREGE